MTEKKVAYKSATALILTDMANELSFAKSTLLQAQNELKEAGFIQVDITPTTTKYFNHKENIKRQKHGHAQPIASKVMLHFVDTLYFKPSPISTRIECKQD